MSPRSALVVLASAFLLAAPSGCRMRIGGPDPMKPTAVEAIAPSDPVVKRAADADFAAYSAVVVEEPSIAADAT